jgi:1-acyl-sn-glycerol-3-phosphate acyltransferase
LLKEKEDDFLFRTIYLALYLIFILITNLPLLLKASSLYKKGRVDELYEPIFDTAYRMGMELISATGSKVIVEGEDKIPQGPVLFVSNHQSYTDIPLLMGFINKPKSYIAKIELSKLPLISKWMKIGKCVLIDRSDPRQSLRAINEGVEILKKGHSLVIFPEGTRSKSSEMSDFKKGSLRLATKAKVPIVPVTIDGSYKIFEGNDGRIKPANIRMIMADPIYTDNLTKEDENALSDRVYEIIKGNLRPDN